MKKLILAATLAVIAGSVLAQVNVAREDMGSGTPGITGFEHATTWDAKEGLFHAPQYLPGYPAAAVIFPRVIDVECTQIGAKVNCIGYNWLPAMGRGEYLMIRPQIIKATTK